MKTAQDIGKRAITLVKRYGTDVSGATAIEYGLIAALIGLGVMVGAKSLGFGVSENMRCLGRVVAGRKIGRHCNAAGIE